MTLVEAPVGVALLVTGIDAEHETALRREGLVPGSRVEVERRIAFGGPAVLRLGVARLAVARSVLATVRVERIA